MTRLADKMTETEYTLAYPKNAQSSEPVSLALTHSGFLIGRFYLELMIHNRAHTLCSNIALTWTCIMFWWGRACIY